MCGGQNGGDKKNFQGLATYQGFEDKKNIYLKSLSWFDHMWQVLWLIVTWIIRVYLSTDGICLHSRGMKNWTKIKTVHKSGSTILRSLTQKGLPFWSSKSKISQFKTTWLCDKLSSFDIERLWNFIWNRNTKDFSCMAFICNIYTKMSQNRRSIY